METQVSALLTSNSSLDHFPDNTLSAFTNVLPTRISLGGDTHRIYACVDSLFLDANFTNVPKTFRSCLPHFAVVTEHGFIEGNIPQDYYTPEKIGVFISQKMFGGIDRIRFEVTPELTLRFAGAGTTLLIHPFIAKYFEVDAYRGEAHSLAGTAYHTYKLTDQWVTGDMPFSLQTNAPRYLRLVMDGVDNNYGTRSCANTLAVIPLRRRERRRRRWLRANQSFFVNIVRSEYIRLSGGLISSVSLKLVDEAGDQISLAKGQPTVVKMRFNSAAGNDFIFRISSQDLNAIGGNSDFRIDLPTPLLLNPVGKWKVALSSIHFPSKFACLGMVERLESVIFRAGENAVPIYLGEEDFSDPQELLRSLNAGLLAAEVSIRMQQQKEEGHLQILFGLGTIDTYLEFSAKTAFLLGLTDEYAANAAYTLKCVPGGAFVASQEIDFQRLTPKAMLLYVDVIDPQIVGSQYARVLKMIPTQTMMDGETFRGLVQTYECRRLEFAAISQSHIHSIHFKLVQLDGQTVKFHNETDDVLINILFSDSQ